MKIRNLDELLGHVVVCTADHGTLGYTVADRYLQARNIGFVGTVTGHVPGHGGDVVWVQSIYDKEKIAAFCHLNELEFYTPDTYDFALTKQIQVNALRYKLERKLKEPFGV